MQPHSRSRFPGVLLAVLVILWLGTGLNPPAGRLTWFLEVGPAVIGCAVMLATFRRFPLSNLLYAGIFVHALILTYGGYYTYAEAPLGEWMRQVGHLSRNHYDRIGHVAQGFFPALIIREILLRQTPLQRGGWLNFIGVSIALAISAFYELLEWWSTLVFAPDVGQKFLGTQGDIWDTQWDMFWALIGATVATICMRSVHDASMQRA